MNNELKNDLLKKIFPPEKFFEDGDTPDDMKIILGWNMYREELLKILKII